MIIHYSMLSIMINDYYNMLTDYDYCLLLHNVMVLPLATRSKKSPLQAIKDNYTISDDDDDDVDNNDQVANDDEDFKSTCNTTNTFRRSTRSSSLSKIKPENDKLL